MNSLVKKGKLLCKTLIECYMLKTMERKVLEREKYFNHSSTLADGLNKINRNMFGIYV